MRVLKFFFTTLLQLIVVGVIILLLLREILLVVAAGEMKSHYGILLAKNYGNTCLQEFGYAQEYWTQLRFVDLKNYQLELVCVDFVAQPVVLEQKKLPPLVSKTSVGSGFVIDERKLPYALRLSVLGRSIHIFSEEHKLYSQYLFPRDLDYASGPATVCQAHGYQCCTLDLQSGQGTQLTDVSDCPKSCFESCLSRPTILSFNSRPTADFESRVAEVDTNQSVTFSYVIGNGKSDVFADQLSKNQERGLWERAQILLNQSSNDSSLSLPVTVVLDFGDGEQVSSLNLQDTFEHVYTCKSRTCFFNATLSATDALGTPTLESELSKIVIKAK